MEAKAYLRGLRISPRKVKIVLDLIRNKPVGTAMAILRNTPKAASEPLFKLVKSAMANAETNHHMDVSKLYVKECFVGPGRIMKRMMPRARGSVSTVGLSASHTDIFLKRSSHITMGLAEKE